MAARAPRPGAGGRPSTRAGSRLHRSGGRLAGGLVCLQSAAELINELSVAIESRVRLKDPASATHVYPSFGFVLQQIAARASFEESLGGLSGRVLKTFVR
jgi:pyruvate/2-oxoglutarate dehydrogenase complex dihydrolipoamide dehydrogenase (E3) component